MKKKKKKNWSPLLIVVLVLMWMPMLQDMGEENESKLEADKAYRNSEEYKENAEREWDSFAGPNWRVHHDFSVNEHAKIDYYPTHVVFELEASEEFFADASPALRIYLTVSGEERDSFFFSSPLETVEKRVCLGASSNNISYIMPAQNRAEYVITSCESTLSNSNPKYLFVPDKTTFTATFYSENGETQHTVVKVKAIKNENYIDHHKEAQMIYEKIKYPMNFFFGFLIVLIIVLRLKRKEGKHE